MCSAAHLTVRHAREEWGVSSTCLLAGLGFLSLSLSPSPSAPFLFSDSLRLLKFSIHFFHSLFLEFPFFSCFRFAPVSHVVLLPMPHLLLTSLPHLRLLFLSLSYYYYYYYFCFREEFALFPSTLTCVHPSLFRTDVMGRWERTKPNTKTDSDPHSMLLLDLQRHSKKQINIKNEMRETGTFSIGMSIQTLFALFYFIVEGASDQWYLDLPPSPSPGLFSRQILFLCVCLCSENLAKKGNIAAPKRKSVFPARRCFFLVLFTPQTSLRNCFEPRPPPHIHLPPPAAAPAPAPSLLL
eukprot:gene8923-6259_t